MPKKRISVTVDEPIYNKLNEMFKETRMKSDWVNYVLRRKLIK